MFCKNPKLRSRQVLNSGLAAGWYVLLVMALLAVPEVLFTIAQAQCSDPLALGTIAAFQSSTPSAARPTRVAETGQFDYLLGEWSFEATTTASDAPPRYNGSWKAWQIDDGRGVMDEFRALDKEGDTAYYGVTVRTWDQQAGCWKICFIDRRPEGEWGSPQMGEAHFENGEMHLMQSGNDAEGPFLLRIRYYDIQRDRFSWSADRSCDGGKTWRESVIKIEARRNSGGNMYRKQTPVIIVDAIEPALPFWTERLGFKPTVEVPDGDKLGFVALQRDGVELMFQTWDSVVKDAGASVHSARPKDHTPLFIEVERLAPIQQSLRGSDVLVLERKTSYGATETIARTPYGQVVTFAEFSRESDK